MSYGASGSWPRWSRRRYNDPAGRTDEALRGRTCERLAAGQSGDLAYEIFLEKADTRLAGAEGFHPMALRVTHIYRREQCEWKIIQRRADFLTPRAG